jgi:hypothetical protein
MMIVNDDSRVVTKLETSLANDARVVIYDCNMFIVQATGCQRWNFFRLGSTTDIALVNLIKILNFANS